jgi:hypothetical protein
MSSQLTDVPFCLRANDIVKHVLNIDSRFRTPDPSSTTSNFYFRLLTPVRNVLRIRITSIEFPNNYYSFTALRRNTILRIQLPGPPAGTITVRIPDGNYLVADMITVLSDYLTPLMPNISITFNTVTGAFSFSWDKPFILNTLCSNDETYDRPYDYGLGFNLGFSRGFFNAVLDPTTSTYTVTSDQRAYFAGDCYVFLKINNFDCVRQTVNGNDFTALAKIVVNQPKDNMNFDDYASQHAKEVTFTAPYDLTRFKIQVLDAYGEEVDMNSSQFSFSMEVLEVRNLNLYNTIRDSFADGWKV